MIRLLFFLIVLIALVWLGIQFSDPTSHALFIYRRWTVEMPLWAIFIVILLSFFVFYFTLRFCALISTVGLRWKRWIVHRRENKAQKQLQQGLIHLVEGQWGRAERLFLNGVNQAQTPLIHYVAAAIAAHEQGKTQTRDHYLQLAHDHHPDATVAIGVIQAQLQLKKEDLGNALSTLNHLRDMAPRQKQVLLLLERLYTQLGDWDNLLKLIPHLRKVKLIEATHEEYFMQKMYVEKIKKIHQKNNTLENLQDAWEALPKRFRCNANVLGAYMEALEDFPHAMIDKESLLKTALKKTWDLSLVKYYGLIKSDDVKQQLVTAEAWLQEQGPSAILYLTLGYLCTTLQLWKKAENYLNASLAQTPSEEALIALGELSAQRGDIVSALEYYREAARCFRDYHPAFISGSDFKSDKT